MTDTTKIRNIKQNYGDISESAFSTVLKDGTLKKDSIELEKYSGMHLTKEVTFDNQELDNSVISRIPETAKFFFRLIFFSAKDITAICPKNNVLLFDWYDYCNFILTTN